MSTSARAASASSRSAASSTIAGSAHLPMLLETPKAEGKPKGAIAIDPLDEQNLKTLRGLIEIGQAGETNPAYRLDPDPPCRPRFRRTPRPRTATASRRVCHASRGRPALRQVCARNVSRPSSTRSRPAAAAGRVPALLDDQTVTADLDVVRPGSPRAARAPTSRSRSRQLVGGDGGKRGSLRRRRRRSARRRLPSGSSASMWPMQPRSAPSMWSVTNAPPRRRVERAG